MDKYDTILIERLEFYGFHGASDAEQQIGHRYLVDVRLKVDTRLAAETDNLADTLCYADVATRIVQIGTTTQYRLLERLSKHITEALFAEFTQIQHIWLRVQKIHPPMNAIVASVGVESERERRE